MILDKEEWTRLRSCVMLHLFQQDNSLTYMIQPAGYCLFSMSWNYPWNIISTLLHSVLSHRRKDVVCHFKGERKMLLCKLVTTIVTENQTPVIHVEAGGDGEEVCGLVCGVPPPGVPGPGTPMSRTRGHRAVTALSHSRTSHPATASWRDMQNMHRDAAWQDTRHTNVFLTR